MSQADLKQRLAYFEGRLLEAQSKAALKEPHPRNFDAGYTTEICKTWAETIKILNLRIAGIKDQISAG
jgi:hypothetical protein